MQIWREDGLLKHYGAQIMNYPGEANKYINNESLGYFDSNGDDYYESYPPFAYMFPYLIFTVINIYYNQYGIQFKKKNITCVLLFYYLSFCCVFALYLFISTLYFSILLRDTLLLQPVH